jgi:hypothetical protein
VNLPPNIYNQTELIIIPSSSVQGDSHILADEIKFLDAIPIVVVRRGTRPDIPNAVGKNVERYSWIIVLTWSGNTKGTRACTKSVRTLKMFRSRECKIRTLRLKLIA